MHSWTKRGVVAVCAVAGCVPLAWAQDLPFEDRVAAQESIERIYYSHQIGATRPFEDVFARELLASKVRTYLRQGVALEQYWNISITEAMLRQEMNRIEVNTRMPGRLQEIYSALGSDPLVIQECLVRPILTERLSSEQFAFDLTIHASTRRRAERLHEQLTKREISAYAEHPERHVSILWKADAERPDGRSSWHADFGSAKRLNRLSMPIVQKEMERIMQDFPQRVGDVGPVRETRDRFTIQVLLEKGPDRVSIATFVVNKRGWNEWWEANEERFSAPEQQIVPAGSSMPTSEPGLVAPDRDLVKSKRRGVVSVGLDGGTGCLSDDSWQTIAIDANTPSGRFAHAGVWTGNLMIVWGGAHGDITILDTGGLYDPVTDSWTQTTTQNAPERRWLHSANWTGDRMIVWGGEFASPLNTGGLYDPLTDSWTPTSIVDAPAARSSHSAVWTGTEMLVWGGSAVSGLSIVGGRYDPSSDTWTPMSFLSAPLGRLSHSTVWTGEQMIVWGGVRNTTHSQIDTGGRYDLINDLWLPTSTINAPSARDRHSAVWTGDSMIVWGGLVNTTNTNTGRRYAPSTDTWSSVSTVDAPVERSLHSAIWSGTRMVIWGGSSVSSVGSSGGRYDVVTDTWSPTSLVNSPGGRVNQFTAWTGDSMLVWGGGDIGAELNDGGQYCSCQTSTFFQDADGDTFGDASSTMDACSQPIGFVTNSSDCSDADGTVWGTPTEIQSLQWSDVTTLSWTAPAEPGGTMPVYDVLRSTDPSDFGAAATCIETDTPGTTSSATDLPVVGGFFTYLPRAETDCPGGGQGLLGFSSNGTPRTGRTCP